MADDTVGRRIVARRNALRLSQEELAAVVGVKQPRVSAWETDASVPTASYLVALSTVLQCSTDYLLGLADVPNPPDRTRAERVYEIVSDLVTVEGEELERIWGWWTAFRRILDDEEPDADTSSPEQ